VHAGIAGWNKGCALTDPKGATENREWGYTRIQGALANVGHDVGRGTVATILRQHGIEPAPERQERTTWQEFLKAHWAVLAAADFFTVEVWNATGLKRYAVLFAIELATRRVQIAGIESEPDSGWVVQCGRQLTDAVDGFLVGKRYLLHDREDGLRGVIVIDEIPRRPDLFPVLRVLSDRAPLPARFLVLGSASPGLLQQSSESLAGRLEVIEIGGFLLTEVARVALEPHWRRGGFPRVPRAQRARKLDVARSVHPNVSGTRRAAARHRCRRGDTAALLDDGGPLSRPDLE
jgi:hypothetical protein